MTHELLLKIIKLVQELDAAEEGFNIVVAINEMELLINQYVNNKSMKKLSNDEKKEKVRQRVVILLASIDQFASNTLKHVDSIALDELTHAKKEIYDRLDDAFDRMEKVVDAKNQTEFSFDKPALVFKVADKSSFDGEMSTEEQLRQAEPQTEIK